MAESLTRAVFLGMACCVGAAVAAPVENLPDPTKPPAALNKGAQAAPVESGPVLQSVLVSRARTVAIISGKTVKVGDTVGDATVVHIGDTEVSLRTGKALQILKLYPNVAKQASGTDTSGKNDSRPR